MCDIDSSLSPEHEELLLELLRDRFDIAGGRQAFADLLLAALDDISGFETMSEFHSWQLTDYFWRKYMTKTNEQQSADTKEKAAPDLSGPAVQAAIADGKKAIEAGGTKADAARVIFEKIAGEQKDVVVAAFIAGATLTEKGALTYWYNCKRKASKKSAK